MDVLYGTEQEEDQGEIAAGPTTGGRGGVVVQVRAYGALTPCPMGGGEMAG